MHYFELNKNGVGFLFLIYLHLLRNLPSFQNLRCIGKVLILVRYRLYKYFITNYNRD